MKKKRKIDYKKRRRNLIIGIIIFFVFISNFLSFVEKRESKVLAEKMFKNKNNSEINYNKI